MSQPLLPPGEHVLEHVNLRNASLFGNGGNNPVTHNSKTGAISLNLEGWTLYAPGAEPERLEDYYRAHWTITDGSAPTPWAIVHNPYDGGLLFQNVHIDARGGSAGMFSEEVLLIAAISHMVNKLKELRKKG